MKDDKKVEYEVGFCKPPVNTRFKKGEVKGGSPSNQNRLKAFTQRNLKALNDGKITPVQYWQTILDNEDSPFNDRHRAAQEIAKLFLVPEKELKEVESKEETVKSIDELVASLQSIKEDINKG